MITKDLFYNFKQIVCCNEKFHQIHKKNINQFGNKSDIK